MEKLEIKHIAPYLPYGLKLLITETKEILEMLVLCKVRFRNQIQVETINGTYGDMCYRPILRPLSDLTDRINPIQHHRYIEDLSFTKIEFVEKAISNGSLLMCDYNYLIEHHFDVFGLIDKGLAIDINTLW